VSHLPDSSLPGIFRDADAVSVAGQRVTLTWVRLRLLGAVIAAVGGALTWRLGKVDLWGCVALVGFAVALTSEFSLAIRRPEREWQGARAVAESIKTLAWRYAVCGAPFAAGGEDVLSQKLLKQRVSDVHGNSQVRIVPKYRPDVVTDAMADVRSMSFTERRAVYLEERVDRQRRWYAAKARACERQAGRWRIFLIVGEIIAILLASGRAFGIWNIDLSGVLAAIVAGAAAWLAVRQYSALASSYSIAAGELGLIVEMLASVDEPEWAETVSDAEEAISREHTMWLASRVSVIDA